MYYYWYENIVYDDLHDADIKIMKNMHTGLPTREVDIFATQGSPAVNRVGRCNTCVNILTCSKSN